MRPLLKWEYRLDGEQDWRSYQIGKPVPGAHGQSVVWLRSALPSGNWRLPRVMVAGVRTGLTAIIGNEQVYTWTTETPGEPIREWPWHIFRVPSETGDGYLYLRLESNQPPRFGLYGFATIGMLEDHTLAILGRDVIPLAVGIMLLMLAGMSLMAFAGGRDDRSYLWLACFACFQSLALVSSSELMHLVVDSNDFWAHARNLGFAVAPPFLVLFGLSTFESRQRGSELRWVAVIVLVTLAAWTATLLSPALMEPFRILMKVLLGASLVTTLFVLHSSNSTIGVRALQLGVIACGALVAVDLVRLDRPWASTPLYAWAQFALLSAMSAVQLARFRNVHSQLRLHATALEARNDQLAQMELELQGAVRTRDEFLSIASHELRNPLATLCADAWLLARRGTGDPAAPAHVQSIVRQSKHLARLVDDMLDASRIARGVLTLRAEVMPLCNAAHEAVLTAEATAWEKGLRLIFRAPNAPVWTLADPTRVTQIVSNLLRNAIQYTPPDGEVHVTVVQEGLDAVMRVRDTGEGMSAETLARLFRLFERGDVQGGEGMGVGLALVRHLVELHGGTVTARSEGLGRGSEFEVRLPTCAAPPDALSSIEECPQAFEAAAGRAVLLVDDNRNLRTSLRLALQLHGLEVQEASDGLNGVEKLLTGAFHAAVVDLRMPGLDGCEVARRVRASEAGRGLRLIALTGHAQADERLRAEQAGFDQVLLKPTDPEELFRLLAQ